MGSKESYKKSEIRYGENAAARELPPLPSLRVEAEDPRNRSEDKNEMSDSAKRHRHGYELLDAPCAERQPEGDGARLYEVRDEKAHPVPNDRNSKTSSISPCAVSARKNDDSNVDQRLDGVKNSQIGNKNRR